MKTYFKMMKWVKDQLQLNNRLQEVKRAVLANLNSLVKVFHFSLRYFLSCDQAKAIKG